MTGTEHPVVGTAPGAVALVDVLNAALPQTQCTRCGFDDCRGYAEALAAGEAAVNRCPPGGSRGIATLARLTGRPALPMDPACGTEAPRRLALIDEAWCIGCALCLSACPVDCIVGGPKRMHTVIDALCTGCELCIPACPVDCISMRSSGDDSRTGWDAWSPAQADEARARYAFHRERLERAGRDEGARLENHSSGLASPRTPPASNDPPGRGGGSVAPADGQGVVQAALARARAARAS